MSNISDVYPDSPGNIPADLTKASAKFKKHAWLAMMGLTVFILIYLLLLCCFGFIAFKGFELLSTGELTLVSGAISVCAALLAIFMAKSLFAVRRTSDPRGIEVTRDDEPKLFSFLEELADEVGAPKPHRVFLTPEVNAAVFYDLSLLNLFFPSKKNLIIGMGLTNTLNLGELKAVLAHEFGHFAQGSMIVGRWVYIAQQIISHMVATRDWLDSIVRFISRIDLRIAWVGWILALIIWSIRSLVDTLFNLVVVAERALSREMEFNADLVAVSVTGSDALVNALHKLQSADHAWQTAIDVVQNEAGNKRIVEDIFEAQTSTLAEMRRILNDKTYGVTPQPPSGTNEAEHRVFDEQTARPPQMWATHPPNRDREDNAKSRYVPASVDEREGWVLFSNPSETRKKISVAFYEQSKVKELDPIKPKEAISRRFSALAYAPEYQGNYLNRSIVRNFESAKELLNSGSVEKTPLESLSKLYPKKLKRDLAAARNLDIERQTLEALERGDLKPSGGVIRHRGEELKKAEIPNAIRALAEERKVVADRLKHHDASCRRAHIQLAESYGKGWPEYLKGLVELLHCTEHMAARADDEHALLVNTWQVITADGQIGYFEKKRMIRVCEKLHNVMSEISNAIVALELPQKIQAETKIDNWREQSPVFNLEKVSKKNWPQWCEAASGLSDQISGLLRYIQYLTLEELIGVEKELRKHRKENTVPEEAAPAAKCPDSYPILVQGNENKLQRKLDLWNRFQLAHGFFPTTMRLLVSLSIVGGTIYGGLVGV